MVAQSPEKCSSKARQVHCESQYTALPNAVVRLRTSEEHKKATATACRRYHVDANVWELGLQEFKVGVAE